MQELEQELGMPLLRRSTHQVTLTDAGRVLAKDGVSFLNRVDTVVQRLHSGEQALQGTITIGMSLEYSYSRHIRAFLRQFAKEHPQIVLETQVYSGSNDRTTVGSCDLFFTPCLFDDIPQQQRILARRHGIWAILPPEHPLLSKQAIYLHQLRGETIVVPYAEELFGPYAQNFRMAAHAVKGCITCIRADTLPTALYHVSLGKGICLAPLYAKRLLQDAFAIPVSQQDCTFPEYLYCNSPNNGAAACFFQQFCDFVQQSG